MTIYQNILKCREGPEQKKPVMLILEKNPKQILLLPLPKPKAMSGLVR